MSTPIKADGRKARPLLVGGSSGGEVGAIVFWAAFLRSYRLGLTRLAVWTMLDVGGRVANTQFQVTIVEDYLRDELRKEFGGSFIAFRPEPRGHEYDAVNLRRRIYAEISTSTDKRKIRSDVQYLMRAKGASRRICILTERDMFVYCQQQQERGLLPRSIEFRHVELTFKMRFRLVGARLHASLESGGTPTAED